MDTNHTRSSVVIYDKAFLEMLNVFCVFQFWWSFSEQLLFLRGMAIILSHFSLIFCSNFIKQIVWYCQTRF